VSNIGDGHFLVGRDNHIRSLKAGDDIFIEKSGETLTISSGKSYQGEIKTNNNEKRLFEIPIEVGEAIAVKTMIIGAKGSTEEVAGYFINAVFKRLSSGIKRIELNDQSTIKESLETSVSFEMDSSIYLVVKSKGDVNWSGSAKVEKVSF
jgi:hypothetical protein